MGGGALGREQYARKRSKNRRYDPVVRSKREPIKRSVTSKGSTRTHLRHLSGGPCSITGFIGDPMEGSIGGFSAGVNQGTLSGLYRTWRLDYVPPKKTAKPKEAVTAGIA